MAAGEDQLEPLIGETRLLHLMLLRLIRQLEQPRLLGARTVATHSIDRPVAGGDRQPGAGIGRRSLPRPALRRESERLLGRVLGQVEVAGVADQGGENAAPFVAEDLVESRASAP